MDIDYERLRRIIEEHQPLDAYQAYYVKDTIPQAMISPLAPPIREILVNAFRSSRRVLDVGCGNGHTLLEGAKIFESGIGVDESEFMLALAKAEQKKRKIHNVEFRFAKGVSLPFDDAFFDMVFSERGPLGHSDETLSEAMRVLQRGGWIVVETGGNFETLQTEIHRFQQHGVEIQLTAAFTEIVVFPDCYEFMRHYCVNWCTFDAAKTLSPDDHTAIDEILRQARNADGSYFFRGNRILLGGRKVQTA